MRENWLHVERNYELGAKLCEERFNDATSHLWKFEKLSDLNTHLWKAASPAGVCALQW